MHVRGHRRKNEVMTIKTKHGLHGVECFLVICNGRLLLLPHSSPSRRCVKLFANSKSRYQRTHTVNRRRRRRRRLRHPSSVVRRRRRRRRRQEDQSAVSAERARWPMLFDRTPRPSHTRLSACVNSECHGA